MTAGNPALQAGVQAVHGEAAGALILEVVRPADMPGLIADMLMGDHEASVLFGAVRQAIDGVGRAPRRAPMLCATCPRPLRLTVGFAVAVAKPARTDAATALGIGICPHCATEPAELLVKAGEAFRRIWPDLRPVTVTHPAGGHG